MGNCLSIFMNWRASTPSYQVLSGFTAADRMLSVTGVMPRVRAPRS